MFYAVLIILINSQGYFFKARVLIRTLIYVFNFISYLGNNHLSAHLNNLQYLNIFQIYFSIYLLMTDLEALSVYSKSISITSKYKICILKDIRDFCFHKYTEKTVHNSCPQKSWGFIYPFIYSLLDISKILDSQYIDKNGALQS